MTKSAVFPGSFNPPTIAHLAISQAALKQHNLDEVVWSVSEVALAKEHIERPLLADRMAVLEQVAEAVSWLRIAVTKAQLLSEIAAGFDVVIMGADKWHQIHDISFYGDDSAQRDASIAALPTVALAPRPPHTTPAELTLDIAPELAEISSTAARHGPGNRSIMLAAAAEFDIATGAWTEPERYELWLARRATSQTVSQTVSKTTRGQQDLGHGI